MNNLIVTIIAIAIAAAVAGSAIFYGGQAYQQYQVSAYAAKTIATMNQIKSAVFTWQQDNPGQYFPTRDPVTGTTYSSSNYTAWGDTLTYKGRQYLNLPFDTTNITFNIQYGVHGSLLDRGASPPSGLVHFYGAALDIYSDASGNLWVWWNLDMGSTSGYGSYGPSDIIFYGQVCSAINQQMGKIPYASNLTINTGYYIAGTSKTQINLPVVTGTFIPNTCATYDSNGYIKSYVFAMPL